ncbi:FkbM family methyltransferase [Pirellulimonas nuda]|uniref:FkbM family methyltransferase n=1 Tax=Pirellulimonas nuda TaxID=2528009 RepID=UPI00119E9F1E|nr:FkbM family methyltransferase [Pirellulimonas nuda]
MHWNDEDIAIDASDLVGRHFCMLQSFDPEVSEILSRSTREDDVFWDIGANAGTTSYQMLRSNPRLHVVAIEPQSALADVLGKNLRRLAKSQTEVHRVGISDQGGKLSLMIPKGNRGRARFDCQGVKERSGADEWSAEVVEVITASELLKRTKLKKWPSLIKIDVEGHEPQVIRSLIPAFASKIPRLVVFEHTKGWNSDFEEMRVVLKSHGYQTFGILKTPWRTRLVESESSSHLGITDFVAINVNAQQNHT